MDKGCESRRLIPQGRRTSSVDGPDLSGARDLSGTKRIFKLEISSINFAIYNLVPIPII
jgi:hypothetical protein